MRMNIVELKDEHRKNAKRIIIGGIRSTESLQDIMTVIEGLVKGIGNVEIFTENFVKQTDNMFNSTYTLKMDICDKEEDVKETDKKDLEKYEALINSIKDAGVELRLVLPRQQGINIVKDAMELYMEREKNLREAARKYSSEVKMSKDEVLNKLGSTMCKLDKYGITCMIDEGDLK